MRMTFHNELGPVQKLIKGYYFRLLNIFPIEFE